MPDQTEPERRIRAPWTPERVAALNAFQERGGMHPFTCPEHTPGSPALVAHADGWHCSEPYGEPCDYRQDWAHPFMADPSAWPTWPFGERHGPTPGEVRAAVAALSAPPAADRAAVLREAADRFDGWVRPPSSPDTFAAGVRWVTVSLRRWADETQPATVPSAPTTRAPEERDLLARTEGYLSALHGSVARHDNLGENLGCAGCELRDEIRAALAGEDPTAPVCKFEQGCHRVVACDPGCAVASDRMYAQLAAAPAADRADFRQHIAALADDLRYVLDHPAPGHQHERPGFWDTSGKPCGHCARLAVARRKLAAFDDDPGTAAVLPATGRQTVERAAFAARAGQELLTDIALRETEGEHALAEYGRELVAMLRRLADEAQQGEETTRG